MSYKFFKNLMLIIVIIGILLIIVYTYFYQPPSLSLLNDNSNYLDKVVSITGSIKNLQEKNNVLQFQVCKYTRCIDSVLFNVSKFQESKIKSRSIDKQTTTVIGKLTEYNNSLEIMVYGIK